MLKKTIALLMLSAAFSAPSWADWDHDRGYGRVIRVEPEISFGFQDGRNHFRILYEFGGERYWTFSDYYPGPWIALPAPRYVYPYWWNKPYYGPGHWERDYRNHDAWRNHDGWDRDHRRHGDWDNGHHGRRHDRD